MGETLSSMSAFGSIMAAMVIDMNDSQIHTIDQLRSFLAATLALQFQPGGSAEDHYVFIQRTFQRFRHPIADVHAIATTVGSTWTQGSP